MAAIAERDKVRAAAEARFGMMTTHSVQNATDTGNMNRTGAST